MGAVVGTMGGGGGIVASDPGGTIGTRKRGRVLPALPRRRMVSLPSGVRVNRRS